MREISPGYYLKKKDVRKRCGCELIAPPKFITMKDANIHIREKFTFWTGRAKYNRCWKYEVRDPTGRIFFLNEGEVRKERYLNKRASFDVKVPRVQEATPFTDIF